MPCIRDHNVIDQIAENYCNNGCNKSKAMIDTGYTKYYANSGRGQGIVYGNVQVKEAIAKITAKKKKKNVATREKRQEFWTETMESKDLKVNMSDKLRASELLGKSEGDFFEITLSKDLDKQAELDAKQQEEAHRLANIRLAEIA